MVRAGNCKYAACKQSTANVGICLFLPCALIYSALIHSIIYEPLKGRFTHNSTPGNCLISCRKYSELFPLFFARLDFIIQLYDCSMQHHDTCTLMTSAVLFFSFILIIYNLVFTPDSPSVFVLIISPAYGKQIAVLSHRICVAFM